MPPYAPNPVVKTDNVSQVTLSPSRPRNQQSAVICARGTRPG